MAVEFRRAQRIRIPHLSTPHWQAFYRLWDERYAERDGGRRAARGERMTALVAERDKSSASRFRRRSAAPSPRESRRSRRKLRRSRLPTGRRRRRRRRAGSNRERAPLRREYGLSYATFETFRSALALDPLRDEPALPLRISDPVLADRDLDRLVGDRGLDGADAPPPASHIADFRHAQIAHDAGTNRGPPS